MKTLVERLQTYGVLCTKLSSVSPQALHSRKRITLYVGVDTRGYHCSVMILAKKSRVLQKEARELMELHARLEQAADVKIMKRYIGIDAPLCSKARAVLEAAGWKLI